MNSTLTFSTSSRTTASPAVGVAAIALTAAAGVVTRMVGLTGRPARRLSPATWVIAGYLAVNTFGNLASSSDVERWLFGPATAIASALTAVVALRTRRGTSK